MKNYNLYAYFHRRIRMNNLLQYKLFHLINKLMNMLENPKTYCSFKYFIQVYIFIIP